MSIKVLLEKKVETFVKDYPEFSASGINKKFLLFSIYQLIKEQNIEYEDIVDGFVDGENDYGIDAIYIFSGGEIVKDDEELNNQLSDETKIRIVIIQVTRDGGYSENILLKLKNGIEEIFDMEKSLSENENFVKKVELIRNIWKHCFDKGNISLIEIEPVYICLNNGQKISKKVEKMEGKIYEYFSTQQLHCNKLKYIGIPELYKILTETSFNKDIIFKDVMQYAESYNQKVVGYYGLVKLKELLKFITNETGEIVEKYFEGNVRDFYGFAKKVNKKIKATLDSDGRINFWCLNNGMTILCDKANPLGKSLKLFNFKIVNGCQTAHVVYAAKEIIRTDEKSEVLIKIVQTTDNTIADSIIDSTNSQTAVSSIQLHANELIQVNIEEYFLNNPIQTLFYERRANYYKKRYKPRNKIITVIKLFQIMFSVFEQKPSAARGRPTESFDKNYNLVFDTTFDYDTYLYTILLYIKIYTINKMYSKIPIKDKQINLIRNYGHFHLLRIVYALMLKDGHKINLKDSQNIFIQRKSEILKQLSDDKEVDILYKKSVDLLRKCIGDVSKGYNLFKSDELDKRIIAMLQELKFK